MKMKKIPLKHVRIIGWTSPVLGILLILLGCWLKWFWLVIAALFVMLAAIIFLAIFNRCPHCRHFLGRAGGLHSALIAEKSRRWSLRFTALQI